MVDMLESEKCGGLTPKAKLARGYRMDGTTFKRHFKQLTVSIQMAIYTRQRINEIETQSLNFRTFAVGLKTVYGVANEEFHL